jgi:tRNA G18 (ribose-2'-O)-methylase SpoU
MKPKTTTEPSLLYSAPAHQAALQDEEHFRRWERNVADRYKDKSEEEIRQDLQTTSHPFAVMFENWIGDFNLGTGIRNANGFNAREIFYIGNRKWDKRGAVGVYNYTPVRWLSTLDEVLKLQNRYTFIGVDNVPGSIPMETFVWPSNSLMIFGEESTGLTPGMQSLCKHVVHIEMYGSVRSFNCGSASAIAMYDFVSKFRRHSRV